MMKYIYLMLVFINIINSFNIIPYNPNLFKCNMICKRIKYNQIINLKENIEELFLNKDNTFLLLKLKNNTVYTYLNTKKRDILGILPIIMLLENN